MSKVYIDKLMGGRVRDAGAVDFSEIIVGGDPAQFTTAINQILAAIEALNYQIGDTITEEMITNYTSLLTSLENLYTEISQLENANPEFLAWFDALIQDFETAIENLVVGDTYTEAIYNLFESYFQDFTTILNEFATTAIKNDLRTFITETINQHFTNADPGSFVGSITWLSGLTFRASDLSYPILGQTYTAAGRDITLAAADPNFPRIDIFVGDRYGNVFAITGTPAADPVKPIAAFDQFEITQANIAAGAVEPSNFTVENIYDEAAPEEWTASATADADVTVATEAVADPRTGAKHIQIDVAIPPATGNSPTHHIGEPYQGGIIFHLNPDGKSGLIAAPEDQSTGERYEALKDGDPYTTGATGLVIGTGQANTAALLAHAHNAALYAVKWAVNYLGGGFNDWFLPSRDELTALYFRRDVVGGFAPADYWSSSEIDWNEAYSVRFSDGYVTDRDKDKRFRVRAIRAFDDSQQDFTDPVTKFSPVNTKLQFLAPAAKSITNGILTFWLKSSAPWLGDSSILIESWSNGIKTGATILQGVNNYGYNPNNGEYQQVAIPLYNLAANVTDLTAFTFRLINTWRNNASLKIDGVRLQYDETQAEPLRLGSMAYKDFWLGTQAEYDAIAVKDANTIYHIEEE